MLAAPRPEPVAVPEEVQKGLPRCRPRSDVPDCLEQFYNRRRYSPRIPPSAAPIRMLMAVSFSGGCIWHGANTTSSSTLSSLAGPGCLI
jgi:hypothetical protein